MNDPYTPEQLEAITRLEAENEADLRWVLAHSEVGAEQRGWAEEYLDHNELGLAWEVIDQALVARSEDVSIRMESARQRMGLLPSDTPITRDI